MKKNSVPSIQWFFLVFLIFSFNGCEWTGSDEVNYVELERPAESIPLGIDLAGANPEEVIQVSRWTRIYYTLYTAGREVIKQTFYLDGVELTNHSWGNQQSYVDIGDIKSDGAIHELKLVMALRTHTGSLAETLRLEAYLGEFTFKLKYYDEDAKSQLNLRQDLHEGKYLKLVWDEPTAFKVDRYEVYDSKWGSSENLLATISTPNTTFFVDENYCYGARTYSVKAYPKNGINSKGMTSDLDVQYTFFNEDHMMSKAFATEFVIEWKNPNPYPAKYVVQFSDGGVQEVDVDINRVVFPRTVFPFTEIGSIHTMYILSPAADFKDYQSYPSFDFKAFDQSVVEFSYWMNIVDADKHRIIGLKEDGFAVHDLKQDLTLTQAGNLPDNIRGEYYFWEDKYSCSADRKVAIEGIEYGGGNVHVFKDYDFTQKLYSFEEIKPEKFCISNTHLFYVPQYKSELCVGKMDTGEQEYRIPFKETVDYEVELEISSDGKYLILYSKAVRDSWYTLYANNNGKLEEIRHVRDRIRLAFFNPQDASQLFLHDYDTQFHVVDVLTGTAKQTVKNNRYLYTDPYTGNVLCYTFQNLNTGFYTVYDPAFTQVLYQVKAWGNHPTSKGQFILANNILYCAQLNPGNYYVDLSDVLKVTHHK